MPYLQPFRYFKRACVALLCGCRRTETYRNLQKVIQKLLGASSSPWRAPDDARLAATGCDPITEVARSPNTGARNVGSLKLETRKLRARKKLQAGRLQLKVHLASHPQLRALPKF